MKESFPSSWLRKPDLRSSALARAACGAILVGATLVSAQANATYVDSAGRTWRSVNATLNLDPVAVSAACSGGSSARCQGSVQGVSLDGWVWADNRQIDGLLRELTGLQSLPGLEMDADGAEWGYWAADTLGPTGCGRGDSPGNCGDAGFTLLIESFGFSASLDLWGVYHTNCVGGTPCQFDEDGNPLESYSQVGRFSGSYWPDWGYFMFSPVPEPGTLVLLGCGLVGLGLTRRRADPNRVAHVRREHSRVA